MDLIGGRTICRGRHEIRLGGGHSSAEAVTEAVTEAAAEAAEAATETVEVATVAETSG